ncbi:MAG: TlpA disulfide reductase family protein [Woeseiaceae bacterium]
MRCARSVVFLLLLLASQAPANAADMAPDWSLVSSSGETVRLSEEVKQQTTVLFFWATWCPYCKALMPHLQSIRLEYGNEVEILAINFREDDDPVAFMQEAGYDFTILPDGDAVAEVFGVHATPGLIIVDSQRQIRFDLRKLPKQDPQKPGKQAGSHRSKAAYRAPYWAAEIRKGIDAIHDAASQ